ncbi:MAG: hypothetical protein AB7T59_02375 [Hyphomonadaceae bacterium]
MNAWRYAAAAILLALAGCNQQPQPEAEGSAPQVEPAPEVTEAGRADFPQVDAALLAAPNDAFTAIEASEVGVFAAPDVMQALAPLLGPEATEGSIVHVTIREMNADLAIADIVRSGLQDDSVSAGHVRIEFRREAEGWFPTNAYRRTQCARGGETGQWTAGRCP